MKARYVLVVALLVLTAGCISGGGPSSGDGSGDGDGTTSVDDASGDGDDGDDGDGADGGAGDGADGDGGDVTGEWEPFSFDEPARYEFEVYMVDEGTGTIVWDVESVDDGEYTVTLIYEMNDERMETTATGTRDDVMGQFYTNPGGIVLLTTMYQPAAWYEEQELSTGTQWSYSTPEGSASFAITGSDTVGGVSCATSEMRVNSSIVHEGCFSPDLGLAPYAAWYGEDGTLELSVTLVSYEQN